MFIENIALPLRNTIEQLELPIYIEMAGNQCRPPARLALGDSLMVLGLLRNWGRPMRLYLDPLPTLRPLLESHPLVQEILAPAADSAAHLTRLAVARSGRTETWHANTTYTLNLTVMPVDQVRANPVRAHSLHYKLERQEDWPSIWVDPQATALAGLLPRQKPALVLFPFNPGRADAFWQDETWWLELARRLRPGFCLIGVGARGYGALTAELDAVLPMDAPESSLMNLAWLLRQAKGFVGRDGGISHLASGVNPNVLTIWDSMGSYRYWASHRGHHILMSNPYIFRYPQAGRLHVDDLRRIGRITYPGADGSPRQVDMPQHPDLFDQKANELFGGLASLAALVLGQREQRFDRLGVDGWMSHPELKKNFYDQSLAFAQKAVVAQLELGENWVAPWLGA